MSSNGRIRTEHAVMGICVILRLHGTIRMNVKAVRQLVTKDAAKLLTISWGTMPKWIRRPGVLVVGIIDQGLRMNPGENGRRHSQIDLDERGKANFERYNRLLSCLYPQLDSYHLDLYINVTGIVSRSVEEVLKLTEEVDCFLTFHEDVHYARCLNSLRAARGLKVIPEKISGVPRAAYVENPHLDAFPLVRKHRKVAVGGTFDHLHSGHKILLTMALSVTSSYFVCGVTGGGLQKSKKYHEALQSLRQRMENVSRFIRPLVPPGIKAQIIELNDPYGPTIEDESIDAIVATEETVKGCIEINRIRKHVGMGELEIYTADIWGIADNGFLKFGSTALRREILSNRGPGAL